MVLRVLLGSPWAGKCLSFTHHQEPPLPSDPSGSWSFPSIRQKAAPPSLYSGCCGAIVPVPKACCLALQAGQAGRGRSLL